MKYSDYLDECQKLKNRLEIDSKELEILEREYENVSPESRSELESAINDYKIRVNADRSSLSSWESQSPKPDPIDRYSGDNILDNSWKEYWQEHSDPVVRERFQTAYDFYRQDGFNEKDALDRMKGINFNQEVAVVDLQAGETIIQYQNPGNDNVGQYFTQESSRSELGIEGESNSSKNRVAEPYILNQDTKALKSTSADISNWDGNDELFYGGGTQYCIPKQGTALLNKVFNKVDEPLNPVIDEAIGTDFDKPIESNTDAAIGIGFNEPIESNTDTAIGIDFDKPLDPIESTEMTSSINNRIDSDLDDN